MRHVFGFLFLLMAVSPVAAQGIGRSADPAWVEVLPLPPVDPQTKAQASGGVFYLLSDHQIRWQGPDRVSYARTVMEVTDRAGLEQAATLNFDFDPGFETVTLTRLLRVRDGVASDLRDALPVEMLRRETQLDDGILDGTLTAVMQIPDLRVGDIVDYSTLMVRKPLVPEGERAGISYLEWSVPVGLTRLVLYWPQDWPLTLGAVPERVGHKVSPADGGLIRHEWRRENNVPTVAEPAVPVEADPTAVVRFSAAADWSALAGALAPYYQAAYPLTPEWEEKLAAIQRDNSSEENRAIAALRLVQDELRYVSLSVGAGGIFARKPEDVIRSGFGDCKDKSLLLRVMLTRMGIKADVALTDIDQGYALPKQVPMSSVFDHMIVRITSGDKSRWVDPTASHQGGGFESGAPPDFGFALPLTGPGQTRLEPIPVTPETAWSTEVIERFRFTPFGVFLTVSSVYGGGAADSTRRRWATTPVSRISDSYLDFYSNRYPGIQAMKDMTMTDDRRLNALTLHEQYFLSRGAMLENDFQRSFPFAAEDFATNLPDRLKGKRVLPLYAGAPYVNRHRIEVRNAPIEFNTPPKVHLVNEAFTYDFAGVSRNDGAMEMEWTYRNLGQAVPPDAAANVVRDGGVVHDTTWYEWDLRPE